MEAVAPSSMLIDPDRHGRCPFNRNRLVVQHMSALDLRFEPATFDVVYSFSTIEHVGTLQEIHRVFSEIHRVLKRGGIAVITTECVVNQAPTVGVPRPLSLPLRHDPRV
jgi:ubiquinone/menaquinone biosynthesis C-methylase UbiE